MARKPRIEFSGALYHVIVRGNRREKIFINERDYDNYLQRVWLNYEKYKFVLYAYCLMPNHVHLLIQTGDVPLSKIMHAVQFSYTQSFNKCHRKIGHVFHGRYKAILCQSDAYLLQLIRYIHNNPVRAYIVDDPKKYCWSSHRTILGLAQGSKYDVQPTLRLFGDRVRQARIAYEKFMQVATNEGHRDDLYDIREQRILGDSEFVNEIIIREDDKQKYRTVALSLPALVKLVSDEMNISETDINSIRWIRRGNFGRGIVAYIARRLSGWTIRDIARHFRKSETVISRSCHAVEEKMKNDADLRDAILRIIGGQAV